MIYFVRTTGERTLDESFSQIKYTLLTDPYHNAGKSFVEWLEEYFCKEDCVVMEDDIILCEDFKNRIEEVIKNYPNDIINFYEDGWQYFRTFKRLHFQQNQCTYYPKEMSLKLLKYIKDNNIETSSCSELIRTCLTGLNIEHLLYRPILVQHKDDGSLMGHGVKNRKRRSIYFVDYLKELGIDYNQAYSFREELTNILEKHFKEH